MRFPAFYSSWALCGIASALDLTFLNILRPAIPRNTQTVSVDLEQFGYFTTIPIEDAIAATDKADTTTFDWTGIKDFDTASYGRMGGLIARHRRACRSPSVRAEWRSLPDQDKTSFVDAVKCLMDMPPSGNFVDFGARTRWDDLVAVHYNMTEQIHGVSQFLQWHRYYLHVFEHLLRSECSYQAPLPWWDETLDAGHFAQAPMFTSAFMGSAFVAAGNQGTCISDGVFAGYELSVGGHRCLARGVNETFTAQCNMEYIHVCNSHNIYFNMERCAETGPHAYGHNGVGAVMASVPYSPNDPTFFLHHGFVDHAYRAWQIADPANRLSQVNGCADKNTPCTALTADYVLTSQGLQPDFRIMDVLDTTGGTLCYRYDY